MYYDFKEQTENGVSITDWFDRWEYMFLAQFKPKADIYDRAEYRAKTRNIMALNLPIFMFMQFIQAPIFNRFHFDPIFKILDIDSVDNYEPMCLLKFKPTSGFFHNLVQFLCSLKIGQGWVAFMADNLWFAGRG